MSPYDLFEFIKELGKRAKMQGMLSILLLFRNKFDAFNNTGARKFRFVIIWHKKYCF